MQWDATLYDDKHRFVSDYGRKVMAFVNVASGQEILDLGCGTGILSAELARNGAHVYGLDPSEAMIDVAQHNYPEIDFVCGDALAMEYRDRFDTVFSNAVFHWIKDHAKLLANIHAALKKGGYLVCEFGAENCVRTIQEVFVAELAELGYIYEHPFNYQNCALFGRLLSEAGLSVTHLVEFDRPTELAGGADGLRNWVRQFYSANLERASYDEKEQILSNMEEKLKARLFKDGVWVADYRRIQAVAEKE